MVLIAPNSAQHQGLTCTSAVPSTGYRTIWKIYSFAQSESSWWHGLKRQLLADLRKSLVLVLPQSFTYQKFLRRPGETVSSCSISLSWDSFRGRFCPISKGVQLSIINIASKIPVVTIIFELLPINRGQGTEEIIGKIFKFVQQIWLVWRPTRLPDYLSNVLRVDASNDWEIPNAKGPING